ncbi:MAG: FAD-binding oxidoreductase [Candidatus Njordarchaeota archaeon]
MEKIERFLTNTFGEKNVVTDDFKKLYAFDAQPIKGIEPKAVVFPTSVEQIRKLLVFASKNRIPIYVRGGGTSLAGGPIPLIENAIVVSMYKMNRIIELRKEDFQVRVEAGVIIDELNIYLKPYKLFFPVDPGSSAACTIGGAIANNSGGVRGVKYGNIKDGWVLSVKAVLPNGNVIETGTNTFKAAAGYDLTHLFIGSEGTLGIIVEATLKVAPLPKYKSVAKAFFRSEQEAARFVVDILHSGYDPSAVEFLDRDTLEAISAYSGLEIEGNAMILIEFSGNVKEEVEKKIKELIDYLKERGATKVEWSKTEDEYKNIWMIRKAAAPSLSNLKPKYLILDPTVPISKIPDIVEACRKIAKKYGLRIATFGHAGDGNVHPNILYDPKNPEEFERAKKAAEEIALETIRLGGTVSGEHGIGLEKIKTYAIEAGETKLRLMWQIKKLFDPNCILNPWKFFPNNYWKECW